MRGPSNNPPSLGSAASEPSIELKISDFKKTKGKYDPKDILIMCDELGELMNADNYKAVQSIKEALSSIARLGRASGMHLTLATQKATSSIISGELMNNIQQSVVLGDFDSGISTTMFEKDISFKAKPEIKGRAFAKSGKEITEFQSYYTTEKDFEYVDKTLFEEVAALKGINTDSKNVTQTESGESEPASMSIKQKMEARRQQNLSDIPGSETTRASTAVINRPSNESNDIKTGAPVRTVSRKEVLDENGEIDYNKFL